MAPRQHRDLVPPASPVPPPSRLLGPGLGHPARPATRLDPPARLGARLDPPARLADSAPGSPTRARPATAYHGPLQVGGSMPTPPPKTPSPIHPFRLAVFVWNQYADWPVFQDIGAMADKLGYDQLWKWDHLYPIFGSIDGPILEGYVALAGWAAITERTTLGLRIGADSSPTQGSSSRRSRPSTTSRTVGPCSASVARGSKRSTLPLASTSGRASAIAPTDSTKRWS